MGTSDKNKAGQVVYDGNSAARRVPISADPITIPAGAAGTYKDFQISTFPIRDANGGAIGSSSDTSLVLTSTTFTREVAFGTADADMVNGDYYINYVTGQGHGRKFDTATSMTATYYVLSEEAADDAKAGSAPATVSVGLTSALAVAANPNRKGLILTSVAPSSVTAGNTGMIFLSLLGSSAAVLNRGIPLAPGDSFEMDEKTFTVDQINAISDVAAQVLAIQETI